MLGHEKVFWNNLEYKKLTKINKGVDYRAENSGLLLIPGTSKVY